MTAALKAIRRPLMIVLAATLTAQPCLAGGVPKWIKWAALGLVAGGAAASMAYEAKQAARAADQDRARAAYEATWSTASTGLRARADDGMTDAMRAQPFRDSAERHERRARTLRAGALGLAAVSLGTAGFAVSVGRREVVLRKSIRF